MKKFFILGILSLNLLSPRGHATPDYPSFAKEMGEKLNARPSKIRKTLLSAIIANPTALANVQTLEEGLKKNGNSELGIANIVRLYRVHGIPLEFSPDFYNSIFEALLDPASSIVATKERVLFLESEIIEFKKARFPENIGDRILEVVFNNTENKNRSYLASFLASLVDQKVVEFSDERTLALFDQAKTFARMNDLLPLFLGLTKNDLLPNGVLHGIVSLHFQTGEEYDLTLHFSRRANGLKDFYTKSEPRLERGPSQWLVQLVLSAPTENKRLEMVNFILQTMDQFIAEGKNPNAKARKLQFLKEFRNPPITVVREVAEFANEASAAQNKSERSVYRLLESLAERCLAK